MSFIDKRAKDLSWSFVTTNSQNPTAFIVWYKFPSIFFSNFGWGKSAGNLLGTTMVVQWGGISPLKTIFLPEAKIETGFSWLPILQKGQIFWGIFISSLFPWCDRSDRKTVCVWYLEIFCILLTRYDEFFRCAVILHKDFQSLISRYKIFALYFTRKYLFYYFPITIFYDSLDIYICVFGYIVESLFYRENNIVPFESVENLVGWRPFTERLLPEVGVHDIGYIIDINELSFHFSQFINNFVEIYHCEFCFVIRNIVVYI